MDSPGLSPADNVFGAVTRFLVEVAAWTLVAVVVGNALGWFLGLVVSVLLILATGTFNAAGDKQNDGVIVPGPVRLGLEAGLALVAVLCAAILWGTPGLIAAAALVAIAAVAGARRSAWLLGRWQPGA